MTRVKYVRENSLNRKKVIVGFFDVIHKGHMSLFENNLDAVVLIFVNVPSKRNIINSVEKRIENLKKVGFRKILVYDVMQNMKAYEFYRKYLSNVKLIIAGDDCTIGHDKRLLSEIVPAKKLNLIKRNDAYSTSTIKKWLSNGEIEKANECLEFPFVIKHVVNQGNQFGKVIGYRTLNFNIRKNFPLKHGVYLSYTYINNKRYRSLSFWGIASNSKNNISIFETHVLNFNKNIYGKTVTVEPFEWLAEPKKVDSIEELRSLIKSYIRIWTKYE